MPGVASGTAAGQRAHTDILKPLSSSATSSKPHVVKLRHKQPSIQQQNADTHVPRLLLSSERTNLWSSYSEEDKSRGKPVGHGQHITQSFHVNRKPSKPTVPCHDRKSSDQYNSALPPNASIHSAEPSPQELTPVPRPKPFGWEAYPTRAEINEVCRGFLRGQCSLGKQCPRIHPNHSKSASRTQNTVAKPPTTRIHVLDNSKSTVETVSVVLPRSEESGTSDISSSIPAMVASNTALRYDPKLGIIPLTENVATTKVGSNSQSALGNDEGSPTNLWCSSSSSSSVTGGSDHNQKESHPPPIYDRLCRGWLMKRCERGYDCHFVHGSLVYDRPIRALYPNPRYPNQKCWNWERGTCSFGYLCNFAHGDLVYGESAVIHPYKDVDENSKSTPYSQNPGTSLWDEDGVVQQKYPPPRSAHFCSDWLRKKCYEGGNCNYFHGDIEYDPPVKGIHPPPRYSDTCKRWQSQDCFLGYTCWYVHGDLKYDTPESNHTVAPNNHPSVGQRPQPSFPAQAEMAAPAPRARAADVPPQGSVDDPPVGKRPPPKYSEICIRWLRGRCDLRYACIRLHKDLEYDPPAETQSAVVSTPAATLGRPQTLAETRPWTVTVHDHAKVTLGPGFHLREIETGFETPWVYLENIPSSTTAENIIELLRPFGEVLDVKIPAHVHSPHMLVRARFSSNLEARQASTSLHGIDALGGKITARLPMHRETGYNTNLQDTAVRIRWEAPGKMAYCGYSSMEHAQEGIAATQSPFRDRYVHAFVHVGVPAVGEVTVCFRGVPPDATKEDMATFGKPTDIVWTRPNYQDIGRAADRIKSILQRDTDLLHFMVVPPPYREGGIAQAWAYFPTPSEAKAVCGRLHCRKPMFTGKTRVFAQHVQTLSFSVAPATYQKLDSDIKALCARVHREHRATMNVVQRQAPMATLVKLSGDDIKEIGQLKAEVEKILNWEIVRQDAKVAWDSFFAYPAGKTFIESVEHEYPSVLIRVHIARRTIYLLGSSKIRLLVRKRILGKIDELRSQKQHMVYFHWRLLGVILKTTLGDLERQLGREKVDLDLSNRQLIIRGDESVYQIAREAVRRAEQGYNVPNRPRITTACPVCFDEVTNPVKLSCGHTWCQDCLSRYLTSSVNNKVFPLTCLGAEGKCKDLIPLIVARKVLTMSEFDAIVDAAFVSHVQSRPQEFHYCPTPDCPQVYRHAPRDTVLQCPSCLLRICPSCHVEAHDGFACPDPEADNKLFREWAKGHDVKPCPGCKTLIERAEGCNHMTCTQCKTHICWVCLQTFPGGDGIYDHMRAEHGGIGLLEEDF